MRMLTLAALLLVGACAKREAPVDAAPQGLFAGAGRNALCIAEGGRAGYFVAGTGDANCSARGRIAKSGTAWVLTPEGETACRIPVKIAGDRVVLGSGGAACIYYCGPGASLDGAEFARVEQSNATTAASNPMTDLAGDPLC